MSLCVIGEEGQGIINQGYKRNGKKNVIGVVTLGEKIKKKSGQPRCHMIVTMRGPFKSIDYLVFFLLTITRCTCLTLMHRLKFFVMVLRICGIDTIQPK